MSLIVVQINWDILHNQHPEVLNSKALKDSKVNQHRAKGMNKVWSAFPIPVIMHQSIPPAPTLPPGLTPGN